jgi:glycosyltransferase involved in cell wall biosynthesis
MQYWLLTSEYPPFFGGGISTYCLFTARMFAANGHQVTVFVNDNGVKDHAVEFRDSVRIIRFNPSRTNSAAFLGHVTNLSYEFAEIVKHFIQKEGKPDIIETQEYLGIGYYLLQFKHLQYDWCKDVPVLVTMHSPSFLYLEFNQVPLFKYPNFWIGEMERFSLQAADAVISPSKFLIGEVNERFELKNQAVSVVPNPFSFSHDVNAPEAANQAEDIVFFGKLSAQKGTIKLLQYFKKLWDEGFTETLHLIGGQDIVYHPENKNMGDLVRKQYRIYLEKGLLKLEDKIAPSFIKDRLKKAKVVIVPSTVDNLPYVVMEMMSLGLIVLVSAQGGQAEIVENGTDGFVFDHHQPETFRLQLEKILKLTAAERQRIEQNAKEKIRSHYSPEVIYAQKIGIINSVPGQRSGRKNFPFLRETATIQEMPLLEPAKPELLSIVIPYYNLGNYLAETINSVKAAGYPHKEILIINDGSTEAESIAKLDFYRNDPEITVIDCRNQGLAAARNLGAEKAKGTFLAFLDADDLVAPDYFTKAINVLRQFGNVHFAGAWTQYFEGSEKIWPTFTPEPPVILYHNTINSSALVYKHEAFLAGGKNDADMPFQGLEDYESVIALLSKGYRGITLPEPLFRYRVRKDSMIRGVSRTKKTILQDYITQKHQVFYGKFACETFNLLNANGPGIVLDNPTLDFNLTDKLPFNSQLSRQLIGLIKKNRYAKYLAYRAFRLLNN